MCEKIISSTHKIYTLINVHIPWFYKEAINILSLGYYTMHSHSLHLIYFLKITDEI